MKTSRIVFCLLLSVIFFACNDTIGRVGLGVQPDEDKVAVFDATFDFNARTIAVDSIYAKTPNGLLGEFYDPSYGSIKSSFICQYYPSIGFPYLDSIVVDESNHPKIDSVRLNLYYSSFIGDSLAPMEVTVYPVIKPLTDNYYTNANPSDYCDLKNPIAKYAYTARNMNLSDSLIQANIAKGTSTYYLSIPLPVKIGQDYLDKVLNGELTTVDDFVKYFPGTYITTTFGKGSMLPIDMAAIKLYYSEITSTLTDSNGNKDSTGVVVNAAVFAVTKEVIQLNKFENKNPAFLTEDNPDKTYLKTPAGVYTEMTIPIKEIVKAIGKKKFSNVSFSLKAYPQDDWTYSLPFPGIATTSSYNTSSGYQPKLLLIQPDSVANFFEMKKVADGQTTFTTQFNASTYTYFNEVNIASLIQNAINKAPDQDLKLWVIPVLTTTISQTNSSGYSVPVDYMTSNYLYPSGVTLKKGGDNLKLRVIAADLKINE